MATAEGVVKLLDFALAKFKVTAFDQTLTVATQAGTLLGTVGYMSPEQAQGQPMDARTDMFNFGAVLYEMLTGVGSLSHVAGLRVIARASSFRLRGETDLVKVGRMLNVAHTLDGSVRKAGNRVRISVQLTRIADETPVWSERFDRDMTDIFAIQDEIADAVVKSLEARDTNFAAAYAGLASCLVTDAILGVPDSKGLLMRSRDLGRRAVELDPNRAEGQIGRALHPCPRSGRCQWDCAVVSRIESSRARRRI
jgi:hypothetical protein